MKTKPYSSAMFVSCLQMQISKFPFRQRSISGSSRNGTETDEAACAGYSYPCAYIAVYHHDYNTYNGGQQSRRDRKAFGITAFVGIYEGEEKSNQ